MTKRQRPYPPRRGSVAVEASLVLSLFLLMFLGIFEYCRFLTMRNLADYAVAEGARFAVVHTYDKTTADVQAQVLGQLAGQQAQLTGMGIQVFKSDATTGAYLDDWTNARFGESIMVQLTGTYTPALPRFLLMSNTIAFKAQSMMRCEAN
jgi:Flp pilus assembly protein TadG